MNVVQKIQVDLFAKNLPPEVLVNQGDNAVQIQALLLNGNVVFFPPGSAKVYVRKPDGKLIYNGCIISENTVTIQTTTQMTAVAGTAMVQLEMTEGGKVLSTPIFRMRILEKLDDGSCVESTDEFTALQETLQEVEELKENGLKGDAATIQIGSVTTGSPGTDAEVSNSGTPGDAVFNFAIPRGNTGNGIDSTNVTVEYQASDSGTEVPTESWGESIPEVAAGRYLWTRTTIPYTDGNSTVSYSVSKIGETGPTGTVIADTDATVEYETPADYTPPASGNTLGTWLGRATRGLSNLFSNIGVLTDLLTTDKSNLVAAINALKLITDGKVDASKALDTYAEIMAATQAGFWPDALAVKEGFNQVNSTSIPEIEYPKFIPQNDGSGIYIHNGILVVSLRGYTSDALNAGEDNIVIRIKNINIVNTSYFCTINTGNIVLGGYNALRNSGNDCVLTINPANTLDGGTWLFGGAMGVIA